MLLGVGVSEADAPSVTLEVGEAVCEGVCEGVRVVLWLAVGVAESVAVALALATPDADAAALALPLNDAAALPLLLPLPLDETTALALSLEDHDGSGSPDLSALGDELLASDALPAFVTLALALAEIAALEDCVALLHALPEADALELIDAVGSSDAVEQLLASEDVLGDAVAAADAVAADAVGDADTAADAVAADAVGDAPTLTLAENEALGVGPTLAVWRPLGECVGERVGAVLALAVADADADGVGMLSTIGAVVGHVALLFGRTVCQMTAPVAATSSWTVKRAVRIAQQSCRGVITICATGSVPVAASRIEGLVSVVAVWKKLLDVITPSFAKRHP